MINIPIRVRNLIKKWGTRNPFKLCEYLGIYITFKDLGKNTKNNFLWEMILWILKMEF